MITVSDTNYYFLPGQKRFIHLATLHELGRTFFLFLDSKEQQVYIEEFKDKALLQIQDDNLFFELNEYCRAKGLVDMKRVNDVLIDSGVVRLPNGFRTS